MRQCSNCQHWSFGGECKRFPPQVVPVINTQHVGNAGDYMIDVSSVNQSYYPETEAEDTCGEWRSNISFGWPFLRCLLTVLVVNSVLTAVLWWLLSL